MKLPRYWAKGTIEATDRIGQNHPFSSWGWSDESVSDARKKGVENASRLAKRILEGDRPDHYLYGDRPVREEILEDFRNWQGKRYAAITRNSYGCHVLNTANIMFVDVDLPRPTFFENLKHSIQRLLTISALPPTRQYEAKVLAKLELLIKDNPNWGVRVYRTRAGLRYLFTHDLFDPKSDLVLQTMKTLEADPLYVKLCQTQESFRARLTPKPWRCGVASPSFTWPWPNAEAEANFLQWNGQYAISAQQHATCRFINEYGNSKSYSPITTIVEIHDQRTKATLEMQLA